MQRIPLDEFVENKNIRYEIVAVDEDTDEVLAKSTSYTDVFDVASEAEQIQAQVDEYLIGEWSEEPDYDLQVKYGDF